MVKIKGKKERKKVPETDWEKKKRKEKKWERKR